MSGLSRFRFRSPVRDRQTDERRFGMIQIVMRSAITDAEAEATGRRARMAEPRRSGIFLVWRDDDRTSAPSNRGLHNLRIISHISENLRAVSIASSIG
jgi:hypothetical protein